MKKLILLLVIFLPIVSMAQESKNENVNYGFFTMLGSSYLVTCNNTLVESKYANLFANAEPRNAIVFPSNDPYASKYYITSMDGIALDAVAGWYITPHFSLGAGIALQPETVPVYLDGRYYFHDRTNAPFLITNIGIFTGLLHANGGHFYSIGGGYRIGLGAIRKIKLLLSFKFNRSIIKDGGYYYTSISSDFNTLKANFVNTHFNNLVFSVAVEL